MSSNNYGVRVRDVVTAGKFISEMDFSKNYRCLSVKSGQSVEVPDFPVIEGTGTPIDGGTLKHRIDHFGGEAEVYDFGNGCWGLCLQDSHENHYFVEEIPGVRF